MIDESKNEDVESLSSDQFAPVVDACTLCDMCFMTKCPYVPPHDFNLDFPPSIGTEYTSPLGTESNNFGIRSRQD